jgi:hypothetical protein
VGVVVAGIAMTYHALQMHSQKSEAQIIHQLDFNDFNNYLN